MFLSRNDRIRFFFFGGASMIAVLYVVYWISKVLIFLYWFSGVNSLRTVLHIDDDGDARKALLLSAAKNSPTTNIYKSCPQTSNSDTKFQYVCPSCYRVFYQIDIFFNHTESCFGLPRFTCYLCHHKFINSQALKDHLRGRHRMLDMYRCYCGREFAWRNTFIKHKKYCLPV